MKTALWVIVLAIMLLAPPRAFAAAPAEKPELLYKTCFPPQEITPKRFDECKNEDCGLADEAAEESAPLVVKGQRYKFLGATDHGMIWGANTYRVIGEDRVRFLLYVVEPVSTKVTEQDTGYALIPEQIIQTVFFSSFGAYRGSAVSVSYRVEKSTEQKETVTGGEGALEMVDLHCSAQKLKIYDNRTLFYRTVEGGLPGGQCVEMLWEKPRKPLQWKPASSLTMDILRGYYCKSVR